MRAAVFQKNHDFNKTRVVVLVVWNNSRDQYDSFSEKFIIKFQDGVTQSRRFTS